MLIKVAEGLLKGEKLRNALTSDEYFSFKGVPFAKPPVGYLRFKNPLPPEKFDGVWDATQERAPCLQRSFLSGAKLFGDEDCLYLNIYTPKVPNEGDSLKPVMVFFYGGGCCEGQKDAFLYGPDFLVAKDVVLVVPNYRLHIFGFLNLGIDDCPGNVGFKDLVAALKWTKENIHQFGGDSKNITIFGESAGATAVLYLLYSPSTKSKGLFHKAIVQSGKIIQNRNFGTAHSHIQRVSRLAKMLGFDSKDPHELHKFLITVPAQDLASQANEVLTQIEKESGESFPFTSSLEIAGQPDERLITAVGAELMRQGPDVPVMIGLCSQEAILWLRGELLERQPVDKLLKKVEPLIVPRLFHDPIKNEELKEEVIEKFRQFYFKGKTSYEDGVNAVIDLYSDLISNRGVYDSVLKILEHSSQPVYPFLISFQARLGMIEHMLNYHRPVFLQGASHADELGYLFRMDLKKDKDPLGTEVDRKISNLITTIWTNFAKYSDPCQGLPVDFKPLASTDKHYLHITDKLTVQPGLFFEERMNFIDDMRVSLNSETKKYD